VRQLNSLRSKLILYIALAAILITSVALALGYYTTRRQLYHQLEARAGALTDQIGYAFEVLIDGDDIFPIQRIIEQTAALEDVFAVAVVDRFGEIMAHNDKSKLGQPLIDPLIPLAINQEQRVSEFTSDRFVIVDPLTSRNYSLVYHSDVIGAIWIEMDLTTLTAQLTRQYTLLVAVMVGLVSLLSLAALVMLQRLIVNRLRHLQCGLKQVEDGDLTYRLTDASLNGQGDEITGLALSFNQMTTALQTRTEQRQKAETSRQASEARMAAMLDTAADAIFTVDAHQKIVTFNRGAEEIFGYQAAEIVGQPLEILIPPDVRQKHHRHVEKFAASVATSRSMGDRPEIEARHKNGLIFPAEATLSKLEQDGEISFTVILRDITDRKRVEMALRESQERLSTVVQAAELGLWDWNIQTGDVIFNDRWAEMLGYTLSELEPRVSVWTKLVHPDDQAKVDAALADHMAGRASFYNTEHRLRHKDGHWVWVYDAGQVSEWNETGHPLRAAGIHVDITERKYAEDALRQSEENFRTFFDAVDDFLFILDEQGNIQYFNAAVTNRLGYTPDALLGQHILTVHPPERRDEAGQIVTAMLHGSTDSCPVPVLTAAGDHVPVETRVYHGTWSGEPALFGITKDLSMLKASEEKFAGAFKFNPSLMAISTIEDGRYVEINNTFSQIIGYSPAEIIGHTSADLNLFRNPNHRQEIVDQMLRQGFVRNVEIDIMTKNGQVRHGSFSADVIHLHDGPYLLTVMNDITDRIVAEVALRQSEARNTALLNAIPDLMFILADDGTLLNFKSTDDQLLFGPSTDIIGENINAVLPPKVADLTTQAIAQTLETGQIQMFEYQLHFPDGLHTFEARLVMIDDNEVLAIVRDISERARLEQMKTDFIHRASHELRTPLTTAMMMVELIREGGPADELQEYWEILGLEMERQRELIEDLLTVGRLESGNFQLDPVPLSLAAVFENVAPAVTTLAEMRQIDFQWHMYPALPPVNGDANGLQQVFINLLGNAVKFSPQGETITVWAVPTEGGVLVQVADNGLGIPPDDLPHLFDRFFRAANATRNEIPGSGVGLYIVKSVVEALGGKIFVNSVLDKGTTFVVWLPLATEASKKLLVGTK
jgi:PAS domain S-box-containing protein